MANTRQVGSIYPPKMISVARKKREDQLRKALSHYDVATQDILGNISATKAFLQNRDKGITVLKSTFAKYPVFLEVAQEMGLIPGAYENLFEKFLATSVEGFKNEIENEKAKDIRRLEIHKALEDKGLNESYSHVKVQSYINGYLLIPMDEIIRLLEGQYEREKRLREGLQVYGLDLREDSTMCHAYIKDNIGSLEETVRMMREMDFFFKSTDYQTIMGSMIRNAYRRSSFDSDFDYDRRNYYDSDYDSDSSDDEIDSVAISKEAKWMALSRFKGEVPDFVRVK